MKPDRAKKRPYTWCSRFKVKKKNRRRIF
jgi:hypothetical protein